MPDEYSTIFSSDPRTGTLTADQLQARRQIAIALATRNRPYPKTIGEGLTALGEGLGEGYFNTQVSRAEAVQRQLDDAARKSLPGGTPSAQPAPAGGASLEDSSPATQAMAYASPSDTSEAQQPSAAIQPTQALPWTQIAQRPQMSPDEFAQRSARNETGGEKNPYLTVGKEVSRSGDRAYGKYQVMGENVPVWTKQYLGREMTPQEFLLDDKAQDQLARARGGEYLDKYGPNGAAAAWFAGENGMLDQKRTKMQSHIANYVNKFNAPLVSRDQIAASAALPPAAQTIAFSPDDQQATPDDQQAPMRLASLSGGLPTPDTAANPARDAVAKTLVDQQQPQPQPQQIAQVAPPPVPPSQTPIVPPQAVPRAPATPAQPADPGPKPNLRDYIEGNPQIKREMDNAQRISLDQRLPQDTRARADEIYKKLEQRANEAYARDYAVWHEDTKELQKFNLGKEQRDIEITKTRGEAEDAAEKRVLSQRLGGRDPDSFFRDLSQEKDAVARQGHMLGQIKFAEDAINAGVITGFGADARINLAKMRDWMFNNKIEGTLASNTERLLAASKSMLSQAVQNIQGKDPKVTDADIRVASGTIAADPSYQLETMKKILNDNKRVAVRSINDYEDKVDYYLAGHRAARGYQLPPIPTDPSGRYTTRLLENRDNNEAKNEYDKYFGEGAANLEIARAKRRERGGG